MSSFEIDMMLDLEAPTWFKLVDWISPSMACDMLPAHHVRGEVFLLQRSLLVAIFGLPRPQQLISPSSCLSVQTPLYPSSAAAAARFSWPGTCTMSPRWPATGDGRCRGRLTICCVCPNLGVKIMNPKNLMLCMYTYLYIYIYLCVCDAYKNVLYARHKPWLPICGSHLFLLAL